MSYIIRNKVIYLLLYNVQLLINDLLSLSLSLSLLSLLPTVIKLQIFSSGILTFIVLTLFGV